MMELFCVSVSYVGVYILFDKFYYHFPKILLTGQLLLAGVLGKITFPPPFSFQVPSLLPRVLSSKES
jgi:hypothetical protein